MTSTRLYRRFDLQAFFPNIGGSRNHADVWFSYLDRETDFFGIGPTNSRRTSKPGSPSNGGATRRTIYRDLADHVQGGVYAQVMKTHASPGNDTTGIPIDESFSSTPDETPVPRWISGFLSNARILSYGGFLAYDTRDDSIGLTRGINIYGRVASADGVGRSWIG